MSGFVEVEMPNATDQAPSDQIVADTITDKLWLEADLLYSGVAQGIGGRLREMRDNPGTTTLQIAGAAALGLGLQAMKAAGGTYARVADNAILGLTILAGLDLGGRVKDSGLAMRDVWNDPTKFDKSRDVIAKDLGGLFVDVPLLFGSASLGSRLGSGLISNLVPSYSNPVLNYRSSAEMPITKFELSPIPVLISKPLSDK